MRATEVAVGRDHDCALLINGTVACWGATPSNLLETAGIPRKARCGYKACDSAPQLVASFEDVIHVRAGGVSTCAVKRDGTLVCWDTLADAPVMRDLQPL